MSVGALSLLGIGATTALSMWSASQKADAEKDIANQVRADRAPFLNAGTNWLQNPQSYMEGPGQFAMDATLKRLSASHGNPVSSPTAMSLANQAAMQDWRNAWSSAGSLGLGGQGIQADMGARSAQSEADIWGNLGGGIGRATTPRSLADFQLMLGGMRA
jgi:hypothetical protein